MQIQACTGLITDFTCRIITRIWALVSVKTPFASAAAPASTAFNPFLRTTWHRATRLQSSPRAAQSSAAPGPPVPAGVGRQTGTFFGSQGICWTRGFASCLLSTSHSTRGQYLPLGWPHVSGDFIALFWVIYYNNQTSSLINCFQLYKYKNLPSILSRMTIKQLFREFAVLCNMITALLLHPHSGILKHYFFNLILYIESSEVLKPTILSQWIFWHSVKLGYSPGRV